MLTPDANPTPRATARSSPSEQQPRDCYPVSKPPLDPPGSLGSDGDSGGAAADATLTIRHEADEMWLALADQADASMGLAWYEQEPHVCPFAGCCDLRVSVLR
jgi:hypothetical protein